MLCLKIVLVCSRCIQICLFVTTFANKQWHFMFFWQTFCHSSVLTNDLSQQKINNTCILLTYSVWLSNALNIIFLFHCCPNSNTLKLSPSVVPYFILSQTNIHCQTVCYHLLFCQGSINTTINKIYVWETTTIAKNILM